MNTRIKGPLNLSFIIIGNKTDSLEQQKVDIEIANKFAANNYRKFKIISARDTINIQEIFREVAYTLVENERVNLKRKEVVEMRKNKLTQKVTKKRGYY